MSAHGISESLLEEAALEWLADLGWEVLPPDALEPGKGERESYDEVVLQDRLRAALARVNPKVPAEAIESAVTAILRREAPTLELNNQAFHGLLVNGLSAEISDGGAPKHHHVRLFDRENPANNDWLASSQLTVIDPTGAKTERRADIVLWVNGIPIAVLELKNPTLDAADVWSAYTQLQTYKREIPSLFHTNEILVISDDVHARLGSLTADESRFQSWRTVDGKSWAKETEQPLKVLIEGVFHHERLLAFITGFVTFEVERGRLVKKIAGYHQFHAVRRAVTETMRAVGKKGDGKIGVVWHTQGSGKSLTMVFYAGQLIRSPALENPTIVVITDRNDLDDQLFGTFAQSQLLLRHKPEQANDRAHLRELLSTSAAGSIFFTTIQKFLPPEGQQGGALSDRKNIIVIADEAHRSQYGLDAKLSKKGEIKYGLAHLMREALPNAAFIGFTGTPIDLQDKSTVHVFGDYIHVYDVRRAVEDKAVVPIYYENRLAKLDLDATEKPKVDPKFEEVTETEEEAGKEKLKREWTALEALAGTPKRLRQVAEDLVHHFETRDAELKGKAMVVCMSRRICAALYAEFVKLRPQWHDDDDEAGAIKVVMTGSASDAAALQPHVRSKVKRDRLATRFKDPKDPLKIVIVRDMWLTGFDVPCLHTLYVDKPMKGHNLMQAIARVNRVFGDKPGGLVVDYIGIAPFLKEAMKTYADAKGEGEVTHDQDAAVAVMKTQLERCRDRFHGFDVQGFLKAAPKRRLELLPAAREHILKQRAPPPAGAQPKGKKKASKGAGGAGKKQPDGYDIFLDATRRLTQAFALAAPHEECDKIRDETAFYQAVKVGLEKLADKRPWESAKIEHAVRQIVANAVVSEGIIDVFSAAGMAKPDISVLSDAFLADVKNLQHKNLAVELLLRLLRDEVHSKGKRSIVQSRKFSEMLEEAIRKYQARALDTVQLIEHLIELAKTIRASNEKGDALKLNHQEAAFYDALAENKSAVEKLKDEGLATIARELLKTLQQNATIDWNVRTQAQAKLRIAVRAVLKKHGYPPDAQEAAVKTVLEQAKELAINVVEGFSEAAAPSWAAPSAAPAEAAPLQQFPFPLTALDSMVDSQVEVGLRYKTRLDAFDRAMAFVVGLELARAKELLGTAAESKIKKALGGTLGPARASMGTWVDASWRLATLLPADGADPIDRAARALVTTEGGPSPLVVDMQNNVVPLKNNFSHKAMSHEAKAAKEELPLKARWEQLIKALEPLRELRLVAVAKVEGLGEKANHYKLRILEGARPFKVESHTLTDALVNEWCYVLRPAGPALSLAPVVSCSYSDRTEQPEVWLATAIRLKPEKGLELVEITSDDSMKLPSP